MRSSQPGPGFAGVARLGTVAVTNGPGPGVLEIKCPHKKGQPYERAPWWYMPQVQGLMEMFKQQWCNLYCWTASGSAVYHITRDEAYWAQCYSALAEFWWQHVIPGRMCKERGDLEGMEAYRYQSPYFISLTVDVIIAC